MSEYSGRFNIRDALDFGLPNTDYTGMGNYGRPATGTSMAGGTYYPSNVETALLSGIGDQSGIASVLDTRPDIARPKGASFLQNAGSAVDVLGGLTNIWLGMKQYGLAKDSFKENKRQFRANFNAQADLANTTREDRQRARLASNPTGYQSIDDHMAGKRIQRYG